MKKKVLSILLLVILLGSLSWPHLSLRFKELLPRNGDVEIAGGVYTPFLIDSSSLYFMKEWEESVDFYLASTFSTRVEQAHLKLTFANKRLLEAEGISRSGKTVGVPTLLKGFSKNFNEALFYGYQALGDKEGMEQFGWFLQESIHDQRHVFELVSGRMPAEKRQEVWDIQKESVTKTEGLLNKIYGFNLKDF